MDSDDGHRQHQTPAGDATGSSAPARTTGESGAPDAGNRAVAPGTVTSPGAGQTDPAAPAPDRAPQLAAELGRTLAVLGAASIAVGAAVAGTQRSPLRAAFGQQTAMWGAVNVAIAGAGAWRARTQPAQADRLRRLLLLNAGLDVGYAAVGAHLAYHRPTFGGRVQPDAARGHGLAVVVQSVGLLKLDLFYAWRLGR